MKIKKKIVAMLLSTTMLLSAAGCTATKDGGSSGKVEGAPTVRLLSMSSN